MLIIKLPFHESEYLEQVENVSNTYTISIPCCKKNTIMKARAPMDSLKQQARWKYQTKP